MMKHLLMAAAVAAGLAWGGAAEACSSNPFNLVNGSTADASQVMADINNLLNCIGAVQPNATGSTTLASGLTIPSPNLTGTVAGFTAAGPVTINDAILTLGNFAVTTYNTAAQTFFAENTKTSGTVAGCNPGGCSYNLIENAADEVNSTDAGSGINNLMVMDLVRENAGGWRAGIASVVKEAFGHDNTALNSTQNVAVSGTMEADFATGTVIAFTGGINSSSTTMTSATALPQFATVKGTGIPYGTYITNAGGSPYTMSRAATATNASAALTAYGAGTATGAVLFASNFVAACDNIGATGTNPCGGVIGSEVDIGVAAGAVTPFKIGWEVVGLNADAVQGGLIDAAFLAEANGSAKWHYGYQLGSVKAGWPLDATAGTAFGVQANRFGNFSSTMAAAYGVSFVDPVTGGAVAFSHCAFYSTGFCIDGNGVWRPSDGSANALALSQSSGRVKLTATGSDTDIGIEIKQQGAGGVFFGATGDTDLFVGPATGGRASTAWLQVFGANAANGDVVVLKVQDSDGSFPNVGVQLATAGTGTIDLHAPTAVLGNLTINTGGLVLTAAAPTGAAGQTTLGNGIAAVANCGGAATACLQINVAGTTRYVPYY